MPKKQFFPNICFEGSPNYHHHYTNRNKLIPKRKMVEIAKAVFNDLKIADIKVLKDTIGTISIIIRLPNADVCPRRYD